MAAMVTFSSKAGAKVEGLLCEPSGSGKAGAVVVLQEWHGLNEEVKQQCARFAGEGFLALAPDLYHGKIAKDDAQASAMMRALDGSRAVQDIAGAAAYVGSHPRANGKVALVGFCLGGALAFAAACHTDGLSAVVPFYGLPSHLPVEELGKIKAPIQAHFAKKDDGAKPTEAEKVQRHVRAAGGHMDLYLYDAGHAFMRSTDPSKYEPESAKLAFGRAIEFLQTRLR